MKRKSEKQPNLARKTSKRLGTSGTRYLCKSVNTRDWLEARPKDPLPPWLQTLSDWLFIISKITAWCCREGITNRVSLDWLTPNKTKGWAQNSCLWEAENLKGGGIRDWSFSSKNTCRTIWQLKICVCITLIKIFFSKHLRFFCLLFPRI